MWAVQSQAPSYWLGSCQIVDGDLERHRRGWQASADKLVGAPCSQLTTEVKQTLGSNSSVKGVYHCSGTLHCSEAPGAIKRLETRPNAACWKLYKQVRWLHMYHWRLLIQEKVLVIASKQLLLDTLGNGGHGDLPRLSTLEAQPGYVAERSSLPCARRTREIRATARGRTCSMPRLCA